MGRKRGGASGANASVADAEKRGGAVNNKPKEVPSTVPSSKKGAPNKKGNGVSTVKNRGNSESLSVIGLVLGLVQIAVLGVGGLTTVLFILAAALPELWVMYPPRLQLIMVDLMLSATTAYTVLIEHNEYWLDALSAMQPDSQNDTSVWLESWVKPHLNDLPKPPTWERPELLYLNWNHGPVYNKTKDDKPYRYPHRPSYHVYALHRTVSPGQLFQMYSLLTSALCCGVPSTAIHRTTKVRITMDH